MAMDQQYADVFGEYDDGTESADETGENGQGTTEPAEGEPGDDSVTGDGDRGEPAAEGAAGDGQEDAAGDGEDGDGGDGETAAQQTPEERHRQAAARRQREDAARAAAEQARIDKVYADMFTGQTDPFTHKPITTEAEFRAYKAAQDRQNEEKALEDAGIKPEVLEQLVDRRVSQHPEIRKAQEALAAAEAERARAVEQQVQEAIGTQLKAIQAVNPAIKSLEDIAAMPTAPAFNRYVQQGLGLEDAYYLANRAEIESKKTAAAKQAAINQTRSKGHLDSGAGGAANAVVVPPEEVELYRAMMPGATDEEIRKDWEKYQKALR